MTKIKLHHVGFVVASIAQVIERFACSLSAEWDNQITYDPLQNVRVAFLRTGIQSEASIELVEPAGEVSPVTAFLKRGGGMHHLCYEVQDLELQLGLIRATGSVIVRQPAPATAFNGRRIAWVITPDRLLLEYLES
jgi:methylmalonyl-CoA/ethylmalonyl-CoA epimerase